MGGEVPGQTVPTDLSVLHAAGHPDPDSADSGHNGQLQRAADLLDPLHDFLESVHNNRFCIDVLALQALLHNARGEHSVALEKLTAALNLAQTGGFIRLFVDLGPQMADLLKRLIKQNVAVDYAGKILAAFSVYEHGISPESSHPENLSTHLPLSSSSSHPASQPLAESLTDRELEILDLLVQRLQNKEIAAKLFISPQTVKKHLNNIYGKLNVTSRRQAVKKAQQSSIFNSALSGLVFSICPVFNLEVRYSSEFRFVVGD